MAKSRYKKTILKIIVIFLTKCILFFSSFFIVFLFVFCVYFNVSLPKIEDILINNNIQQINVLYSGKLEKIKSYNSNNFNSLSFGELPSSLISALLSTEDKDFFEHRGFSYKSILRAFLTNLRYGHIKQGGSTITQQLSKMILNDHSRTYRRKFKELLLARKLERNLDKKDILLLYLNMSYFGAGQYGIIEASNFYFGKKVKELDLEESAMLVGLLRAPSRYNPISNSGLTINRTNQVLKNMQSANTIAKYDFANLDEFKNNILTLKNNKFLLEKQNYFFTDYIYNQLMFFNINNNLDEISVITTMNKKVQNQVIVAVNNFMDANSQKIKNSEVAVVVLDRGGKILSMIGGKDYVKTQFNRAIEAKRQIGSLFKLFIYLTGFENGLKIDDIFIDEPIKIGNWLPENNNGKYNGRMTVKEAFEKSSNSVAVQIGDYFTLKKVLKTTEKLGIKINDKNDHAVLLGTKDLSLLDITSAYATIFNDGKKVEPYSIISVFGKNEIFYERDEDQEQEVLFPKDTIDKMKYLLYSVIKDGTGKNAKIDSLINKTENHNQKNSEKKYFIGGKTGTSQSSRDAWFIGYAEEYIIGIWIGNDDNSPTNNIMGGNLPAMLWRDVVERLLPIDARWDFN